jgi:hypothetical protein
MKKYKASIVLFAAAIAAYVLLGIVLPEISYTPDAQVEGGWNAIQLAKAMAEVAAPVVALILAFLGFLALFRKQK